MEFLIRVEQRPDQHNTLAIMIRSGTKIFLRDELDLEPTPRRYL